MSENLEKNHSLKKSEVLNKNDDIKKVLSKGTKIHTGFVKAFYLESKKFKIAFVVPKALGNAVFRNKVKRWMREAYRKNKILFPEPVEIILMLKRNRNTDFNQIEKDVIKISKMVDYK